MIAGDLPWNLRAAGARWTAFLLSTISRCPRESLVHKHQLLLNLLVEIPSLQCVTYLLRGLSVLTQMRPRTLGQYSTASCGDRASLDAVH